MNNKISTEIGTNKYDLSHINCGNNVLSDILDDITHDRIGLFCDNCGKYGELLTLNVLKEHKLNV